MSLEEVGERVVDELITSIEALEEELKPFLASGLDRRTGSRVSSSYTLLYV